MKNSVDIQRLFYALTGFARELQGPKCLGKWKIEYSDSKQTLVLIFGESTLVYLDAEKDLYSIEIVYAHPFKKAILIASELPRNIAQEFLWYSIDSIGFNEKRFFTEVYLDEEDGSLELFETLTNSLK